MAPVPVAPTPVTPTTPIVAPPQGPIAPVVVANPFGDPPPPPITDTRPPPSEERVEALRAMEREVDRLREASGVYQSAVDAILSREYQRQRRVRTRWFTQRIDEERAALVRAREDAIAVFEAFVEHYPFDATYTPDAMFRLGELYFERSQQRADDASVRIAAGDTDPSLNPEADYSDTVRLYRTLVTRFPAYERIDSALYLIGYCSYYSAGDPNGRREARAAWLGITCPNRFPYRPSTFDAGASSRDPLDAAVRRAAEQAAAEANAPFVVDTPPRPGVDPPPPTAGFDDPFVSCQPLQARDDEGRMGPSRHLDESWLRIGETYFDEEGTLNGRIGAWLSIFAYSHLLNNQESPHFEGALYKTAWAYFKVTSYVQAVRSFARLLDRVDSVAAQGGRVRAGGQLRPEALRFFALSLMYVDWDRMQVIQDGQNTLALGRLRQFAPDVAPWSAEAYFETGGILYEEQRYLDAVAVWRYALGRWPTNRRAPEITEQVRLALHQMRDDQGEAAIIDLLGRYGEGSAWWTANQDHPAEQMRAQDLASNALLDAAFAHHERAQQRRASCNGDATEDPVCFREARAEYIAAVVAYREYLRQYPNDPRAYELHFSLADALYRAGEFEGAAEEFAWVRDSNLDNEHLSDAGRGVVESYRELVATATSQGRLVVRTTPPPADARGRVSPTQIPDLVIELARARQTYNARVDELHDTQSRRAVYDYDNAMILYLYGYWDLANQRLARIFDERCAGPNANEWGQEAWTALRAMAMATNDADGVANLARDLQERQCTFSPDGTALQANREVCDRPENRDTPQCQSLRDLTSLEYREALQLFRQAQATTGPDQRALYEQAATLLVRVVDEHPEDPQAPQALELAAQALTATSRFESAGRLYERIVREVGARTAADDAERRQNETIVANAIFQLAENAKQYFDFDRALGYYRQLADDTRFAQSTEARVQEFRRNAVTNAALLLQRLRRYSDASQYFTRLIQLSNDTATRRGAELAIADMAYQSNDYTNALRLFREFIRRYASDSTAGASVVEAYWNVAESVRNLHRPDADYRTALNDVVSAYRASGQQPGSPAAYFAAKAAFALADVDTTRVLALAISVGRPASTDELLSALQASVTQARTTLVDPYVARMAEVEAYRVPEFFIAARVAESRAYERLVDSMREALRNVDYRELVLSNLRRTLTTELQNRGITGSTLRRTLDNMIQTLEDDGRVDETAFEVQSQVETTFDQALQSISCDVVVRYVTAIRVATAARINDAATQYALNRMQTYSSEQIGTCVSQQQSRDATFQPYAEGEFQRATQRPGLDRPATYPVPPLATEVPR